MSWQTLEDHDAELAGFGTRRLGEPQVAFATTYADDGTPVRQHRPDR